MRNTFPARDRKFITTLSEALHLSVSWDEYDEEDQNLIILRLPGGSQQALPDLENGKTTIEEEDADEGEQWEDVSEQEDEDEEARCAVDRVLKKYEKAKVVDDDEGGGFDARYEEAVQEKLTEWKRNYYKVSGSK